MHVIIVSCMKGYSIMIAAVNTKETSIDTFIPLEARLLPFHRISLLLHPANRYV